MAQNRIGSLMPFEGRQTGSQAFVGPHVLEAVAEAAAGAGAAAGSGASELADQWTGLEVNSEVRILAG